MRDRAVWLLRVLWFLLPLTVGATIDDAWAGAVVVGVWVLWGVGLVATAVLLPVTLTVVRVLAGALPLVAIWAAAAGSGLGGASGVLAIAHGLVTTGVGFNALIGDRFVDGASYGNERRMLLRPPTALLVGPGLAAWVAGVVGALAGPALLADRRWVLGAIVTAAGIPLAALALRALHQLSRRWIVFVPTGLVLHDLNAITEPVLFRRTAVERLGPAIAGTPARDLSLGAPGLLIECELTDPAPLGLRTARRDRGAVAEMVDVRRFLFAPSRPGDLLDEAEARRIPVG